MNRRPPIGACLGRGVIDGNDAGVMHHLHQNHDVVIGLHELVGVVVQSAHHARSGLVAEAYQAALGVGECFGTAIVSDACGIACAETGTLKIVLGVFPARNPAVCWIDNIGRSVLALDQGQVITRLYPEIIVGANAEIIGSLLGQVVDTITLIEATLDASDGRTGGDNDRLFWRNHQAFDPFGALQVGEGFVGPGAFKVRSDLRLSLGLVHGANAAEGAAEQGGEGNVESTVLMHSGLLLYEDWQRSSRHHIPIGSRNQSPAISPPG